MEHDIRILVSVILPAFNASKTISRTLDSLIAQTLSHIEIIVIDDGSIDETLPIALQYQKRHPSKIRVISGSNQGSFAARSRGIEEAKGKYVAFCDADDIAERNMLEVLYRTAERGNSDIAICSYHREQNGTSGKKEMDWGNLRKPITSESTWLATVNTSCWNKLIRTELAKKHIVLNRRPTISEDAIFLLSIYPFAKSISFTSEALYRYIDNDASAMKSLSEADAKAIAASWMELRNTTKRNNASYLNIIDLAAFIHLGVSLPLIVASTEPTKIKEVFLRTKKTLDEYFPEYKKRSTLSFGKAAKEPSRYLLAYIAIFTYKSNLFPFAIAIYSKLLKRTKRNIGW